MTEIERIERINTITSVLQSAVNDWPEPPQNLSDFLEELEQFTGSDQITLEVVKKNMEQIRDAWKVESLSHLPELFELYDESISLQVIFTKISNMLGNMVV